MALVKCSECGKEISDKAQSCPGCGAPIGAAQTTSTPTAPSSQPPKKSGKLKYILVGFFVVVVLGGLIGKKDDKKDDKPVPIPSQTASIPEYDMPGACKILASEIKTPPSFQEHYKTCMDMENDAKNLLLGMQLSQRIVSLCDKAAENFAKQGKKTYTVFRGCVEIHGTK